MSRDLLDPDCHVDGPVAIAGRGAALLTALVGAVALVGNIRPDPWTFALTGACYSTLLSFSATGLLLLPAPFRVRTLKGVALCGLMLSLALMSAVALWRTGFGAEVIGTTLRAFLWAFAANAGVLFALSCYGWYYRYGRPSAFNNRAANRGNL